MSYKKKKKLRATINDYECISLPKNIVKYPAKFFKRNAPRSTSTASTKYHSNVININSRVNLVDFGHDEIPSVREYEKSPFAFSPLEKASLVEAT